MQFNRFLLIKSDSRNAVNCPIKNLTAQVCDATIDATYCTAGLKVAFINVAVSKYNNAVNAIQDTCVKSMQSFHVPALTL